MQSLRSRAAQRLARTAVAQRQFHQLSSVSRKNAAALAPSCTQVRRFNIHEHQSMDLFNRFGVPTPQYKVATTAEEAETAAQELQGDLPKYDFVVKAQVLAGGRGKGHFSNGFQGGVHPANSPLEVHAMAAKMLGNKLITKQTGAEGKPCHKVMVTERLYLRSESYFAILMDREAGGPIMVASPEGGMDIESVAESNPELIYKLPINIQKGPQEHRVKDLAKSMGFDSEESIDQATTAMINLYKLFIECDATQVEINPLAETHDGKVLILDAKLNFDDNAAYRQVDLSKLSDPSQEDPREVAAAEVGLNYIGLEGTIGCLVNGAGLAMATMDAIELNGGSPANFLDMGGGASASMVTSAMGILNDDNRVESILINIFGGIMRCDVIALGLINAVTTLGITKPIVVRLAGTNVEKAKQLIDESGMRMLTADDLQDAAEKAVKVSQILRMAREAHLDVHFELPV